MLDSIREKTSGWIGAVVLGLVILTMAFFGMESYLTGQVETHVARIEGPAKFLGLGKVERLIDANEFRQRFDRLRQIERSEQGAAFDASRFESLDNKREVLDQLVDEALLDLEVEKHGMVLSKAAVQKAIMERPEFQVAGRFDPRQYQLVLSGQQMSPREYERLVSADLLRQMLPQELMMSGISGEAELQDYLRATRQVRDVRFIELEAVVPNLPPPTDAEVQAWYQANAARYRSPERVAIEYVELNAAAMPVDTVADEGALRERYDAVKSRFGTVEQRLASHILVKLDEKATPAQVAAAQAKARSIAARARAPGADFAALARETSDDLGSRDAGGDLGPVEKGVFGEEFDKVFLALQPGQVSDPIRLPDGFHVVWFRELVPGSAKPFEEVRQELEAEYLESERERAFNDVAGKLVDKIYETPAVLAPAAKALGLPLRRTGLFSRSAGEGIAALPQVREAAFADPQKNDRQVSEPIEVEPNHTVVLRVIDVQPAAAIALASVRDRVVADLLADRVAKASKQAAQALLARAQKGETLDAIAASLGKTVAELPGLPRQAPVPQLEPLVEQAFRLPKPSGDTLPVALGELPGNRYFLLAVSKVTDGDPKTVDAATQASLREQIGRARGMVEARAFLANLRKQYEISIAEERL